MSNSYCDNTYFNCINNYRNCVLHYAYCVNNQSNCGIHQSNCENNTPYCEKPSCCIYICILANAKPTLKMQKSMQPNPIRFGSLYNKTMQISSRKGYLQHGICNKAGKFGYLIVITYIYSKQSIYSWQHSICLIANTQPLYVS